MKTTKVDELINLLEANKNIILTGAPGTGKTYLARQIATKMNAEVGFVQFHPSYDYTDFVEGLRPTPEQKFERRDGAFKSFCKKAIEDKIRNSHNKRVKNSYAHLVDRIKLDGHFKSQKNNTELNFSVNKDDRILFNGNGEDYFIKLDTLIKLSEEFTSIPALCKINEDRYSKLSLPETRKDKELIGNLYFDFLEEIYEIMENPKYVFIIDEINRGDISKIFGELFYAIDPGYRGEKGRVRTQYQNLVDEQPGEDPFKGSGFYVPENIYIIGTMNDIDRSVESMDFAMRRRFTWIEVTAEQSAENMKIEGEKNARMTNLNNAIANMEDLGKAYQLGGAYFLDDMSDDDRWIYKIEPLLKEYLRGADTSKDDKLRILKEGYDNTTKSQEQ